jgi:urease accessory protein
MRHKVTAALFLTLVFGQPAYAAGSTNSIISGLLHPVLGFDHLMAMIAVGLLSVQLAGRHIIRLPLCFVLVLLIGALAGLADIPLPQVEGIISVSVFILGLAIVSGARGGVLIAYPIVAVFAFYHGHAHGAEIPSLANPSAFIIGFMTASALLHLIGVSIGAIARNATTRAILGAGCAGVGLHMALLTYGLV